MGQVLHIALFILNIIFWISILLIHSVACISRLPTIQQEVQQRKLLYMALYLLIWGEAANLRFMPECLCYIYHHVYWHMLFFPNGCVKSHLTLLLQIVHVFSLIFFLHSADKTNGCSQSSTGRKWTLKLWLSLTESTNLHNSLNFLQSLKLPPSIFFVLIAYELKESLFVQSLARVD